MSSKPRDHREGTFGIHSRSFVIMLGPRISNGASVESLSSRMVLPPRKKCYYWLALLVTDRQVTDLDTFGLPRLVALCGG